MTILHQPQQQKPLLKELQKLQQAPKPRIWPTAKTTKNLFAVIAVTSGGPFDGIRGKSFND